MPTFNYDQIKTLWTSNGGPAGWAPLMAAIALAESGGDSGALNNNPSTGDYSVGLWQINYFNGMLAERTKAYGSPQALQADPNLQAKAAISLFGGGPGITNWTNDPAWRQWVNAGRPQQPSDQTVMGWVQAIGRGGSLTSAGSALPASDGGGTQPSASGAASSSSTGTVSGQPDGCMIGEGGLFGVGSFCLLSRGQGKAIKGALLLAAGGLLMGLGVFEVVMVGLTGTKAGRQVAGSQVAKVARKVVTRTPVGKVAGKVGGTGSASRRSSGSSRGPAGRAAAAGVKDKAPTDKDLKLAYDEGERTGRTRERAAQRDFDQAYSEAERRTRRGPIRPDELGVKGRKAA